MHNLGFALQGGLHVLLVGLVLGAGLPMIFGLGVRSLAAASANGGLTDKPNQLGKLLGILCFGLVIGGVALGITFIVASGFGKALSFEYIIPILVDK